MEKVNKNILNYILKSLPQAEAEISGGEKYPAISGSVEFYPYQNSALVVAQISGLPKTESNIFAFHIHAGESCGNDFKDTEGHYSPKDKIHPLHAGDMPPLFSNDGNAFLVFYTDRFTIKEILGKVVVIHENVDDFTSQPAGNSGEKIACGEIRPVQRINSFWLRK